MPAPSKKAHLSAGTEESKHPAPVILPDVKAVRVVGAWELPPQEANLMILHTNLTSIQI